MAQPQRRMPPDENTPQQIQEPQSTPQQPQPVTAPPAEQTGFTEREQRQIEQIKRDLSSPVPPSYMINTNSDQSMRLVEEAIRQINPALVGRNVMFTPRWLEIVGPGKPLPPQPFQLWRDRTDMVYDAYADLTGQGPGQQGEMLKILIDLQPRASFRTANVAGMASGNSVRINKDHGGVKRELAEHNSWNHTLLHEMAHVFTMGQRFTAEPESMTNLLTAYILENIRGSQIGVPGRSGVLTPAVGTQFRKRHLDQARANFSANRMEAFSTGNYTAYCYGLLAPVDVIGWEPYKQVFRSYNDESYDHNFTYRGGSSAVRRAREFFDRLAHFSGMPDLMASLPDRGAIFEQHFGTGAGVVATARTITPVATARTTAPSTATQNTGTQQMSTAP